MNVYEYKNIFELKEGLFLNSSLQICHLDLLELANLCAFHNHNE